MNTWEQRGRAYYRTNGDWEEMVSKSVNWRRWHRRVGDHGWELLYECSTREEAMR